jgi:hypothetical protein
MDRDVTHLPELATSLTIKAVADAAAAFVGAIDRHDDHDRVIESVRDAVLAAGHRPVAAIVDQLLALERDGQAILAEAAQTAAMASAPYEELGLTRGVPSLDLPPISLATVPPAWTSIGRPLRVSWAERHVRERCAGIVEQAMSAHLHVLRAWARSTVARLRHHFDGESRPPIAQLDALVAAPPMDGASVEAVREDLAWLKAGVSRSTVSAASTPPPHVVAQQE